MEMKKKKKENKTKCQPEFCRIYGRSEKGNTTIFFWPNHPVCMLNKNNMLGSFVLLNR